MPVIYRKHCDYCGKYYEKAGAKRFCSNECVGKYNSIRQRYENEPTKDELYNLYVDQKLGTYQIADRLHIPVSCIKRRMARFEIQLRPPTLAQKVAAEQGRIRIGENHPNWKGGRKYRNNGYNAVLKPEHPRAGKDRYVQEHIVVWEEAHKRFLPDDWVIHHKNGIKNDNRLQNLLGIPKNKHHSALVMQGLQERIRQLEEVLVECHTGGRHNELLLCGTP